MTTLAGYDLSNRHPATRQIARWLVPNPSLPAGVPADISYMFEGFAARLAAVLPDGPELTTGLRKLVEAKDCMVRAAIEDTE
jgi:hypothetical protein